MEPPRTTVGRGNRQPGFSKKRRATVACTFCQFRKVRCNVEEGVPCLNCRLDQVKCEVAKTQRTQKRQRMLESTSKTPRNRRESALETTAVEEPQGQVAAITPDESSEIFNRNSPGPPAQYYSAENAREDCSREGSVLEVILDEHQGCTQRDPPSPTWEQGAIDFRTDLPPSPMSSEGRYKANSNLWSGESLPSYIKPLPPHLDHEDIRYLTEKGALSIPSPALFNSILEGYVQYIHPFMPVLDLPKFLGVTRGTNALGGKISLLLFQAVMFAGSAYVGIKPLRMMGFLTRKAARKALFKRVRLLYDQDYEQDRICLIQSLLLMSLWYETPDDQKDAWHWIGRAHSLALTVGLNQRKARQNSDPGLQKLRRRIWWSLYNRDAIVSLGLKRPMIVSPKEHDISILMIEDFDIELVSLEYHDIPLEAMQNFQPEKQRQLAILFIEMTKVCKHLRDILSTEYAMTDKSSLTSGGKSTTMVLLPRVGKVDQHRLRAYDHDLQLWRERLPKEALYNPYNPESSDFPDSSLQLHRALLHMVYCATLITLFMPKSRSTSVLWNTSNQDNAGSNPRTIVRSAANEITRIALDLHQLDLFRLLPQTGFSALVPAMISHISDTRSDDEQIRQNGLQSFNQCWQMMRELQDSYYSAHFATKFIEVVARWTTPRNSRDDSKRQEVYNRSSIPDVTYSTTDSLFQAPMISPEGPQYSTSPLVGNTPWLFGVDDEFTSWALNGFTGATTYETVSQQNESPSTGRTELQLLLDEL
ncbi:fungal-specific transcription factor domain-containing protein [Talaromyces proteolyticus]|uniref:Fungal-specific transcription factor domain-containing protein n=1 Tax=Talaromyces proteolyticus TaxID=1131652 RepID=A0AAD4Q2Y4_9EURO|nr:fungal-specific transcription factor domain-containing protein [Talaromyces proteolyticus]KAH8700867.1 fungal-specific transcription factor domain-containing protein [Talaromyces proteolyticus]